MRLAESWLSFSLLCARFYMDTCENACPAIEDPSKSLAQQKDYKNLIECFSFFFNL